MTTSRDNASEPVLQLTKVGHPLPWSKLMWSNRTVIAASSAAVTSVLAGFPFDSLKTRMQTHHYDSMLDCVRKTYLEEGARGFFRGMIPPLLTVSVIKSISFSIYEGSKRRLQSYGLHGDTLPSLVPLAMLSGGSSGAFIALLSCPLELVKIQRQLEQVMARERSAQSSVPAKVDTSSWHAAQQIVRRKGFLGLWSGLGCHSARDTLGTSLYFGGYEAAKRIFSGPNSNHAGPWTHFLAGGVSGIFSWLVVFPVDLVKSVMQKDVMLTEPRFKSVSQCVKHIIRRRGVQGLYRGLNVTLIRAFPIHSLNFLVYEQVLRAIAASSSKE